KVLEQALVESDGNGGRLSKLIAVVRVPDTMRRGKREQGRLNRMINNRCRENWKNASRPSVTKEFLELNATAELETQLGAGEPTHATQDLFVYRVGPWI